MLVISWQGYQRPREVKLQKHSVLLKTLGGNPDSLYYRKVKITIAHVKGGGLALFGTDEG